MGNTVLVVEDEESLCLAYQKALQKAGLQVVVAKDGQSALDYLAKHTPSAMILDILLPGEKDGLAILEKVKTDQPNLPIFVVSNIENSQMQSDIKNLGVSDYLVKANTKLQDIVDKIVNSIHKLQ